MNKEQREAAQAKKKAGNHLAELLEGLRTKTAALMVEEIARARAYLGSPLTAPECEAYLKQSPLSLASELQQIGATVELRQKTEQAEYMRRALERAEGRDTALDNLE